MRQRLVFAIVLAVFLPLVSARAQSICGTSDLQWCDRSTAGADGVPGTMDDRPECVSATPPPGTADCSQHASDSWTFGGLAGCSDCPRTLFLAVNCGQELWIVVDHAQAMTLSVTDLTYGPAALEAENECAFRRSGASPVETPFAYCDGCTLGGQNMAKDDPFSDGVISKNANTCTTNMGSVPESVCLGWHASGTSITWGRPLDVDPGPGLVFDADFDGFVDATEPMPCSPCLRPTCMCGTTSEDDRAMTGQFVRVKVTLPTPVLGPGQLLRIDMVSGGEPNWTVYANCDGTNSRGYTLHDTCAGALGDLATLPALPSLTLDPDPSVALSIVDTSACPNSMIVAVTTCNAGSASAPSVPVTLRDHGTFAIGETDVDNAAHPTDPACQGPLDPGDCRTCLWEVVATMPSMTTKVEAWVDFHDLVDECGDFPLRGGCGIGPERASVPWCGTPSCLADARLAASATSACVSDSVTLDSTMTSIAACSGIIERQYTDSAGVPLPGGDFPAPMTLDWIPATSGVQRLSVNVRCSTDPACTDSAFVDIDVSAPIFASVITATSTSACGVRLDWTPSASSAFTYDVYRDATSPVPLDAAHLVATALTSPTWDDVLPGPGTVYYRVIANTACGAIPNDAGDAAFTPPSPAFVSAVSAVAEGDCALRVTWDASASAPAVAYDLHRSATLPVAIDASTLIASGLGATSYLDAAPWAVAHAYRVVAVESCSRTPNDGGDSVPVAVEDRVDPSFAGIVNTRDLGFCQVEVSWDDATASDSCSGIAGFNVYRDHGVGHRGDTRIASLVPASPYIDTTPGNGTWVYVVRAVDAAGREEQNDIFQQESEGSCTNDFPGDAGLGPDGGVDSPNADRLRAAPAPHGDRREFPGREIGSGPVLAASPWADGRLRLRWTASIDEGGLYPVTYSVLRGELGALRATGYAHALATPTSCGLTPHELILDDEIDGRSSYYLVVAVSGDNATFGYDSSGRELPAALVCE